MRAANNKDTVNLRHHTPHQEIMGSTSTSPSNKKITHCRGAKRKLNASYNKLAPPRKKRIATIMWSKSSHTDIKIILFIFSILEKLGLFYLFSGSKEYLLSEPLIWGGTTTKPCTDHYERWASFSNPNSIYILIYPNPGSGYGQHAAVILGSTATIAANSDENYVSWTYKEGCPLRCKRSKATFEEEYKIHGEPEIIELNDPNFDIEKMKSTWKETKKTSKNYKLFSKNCSHVALDIIKTGLDKHRKQTLSRERKNISFLTTRDIRKIGYRLKSPHQKKPKKRILSNKQKINKKMISKPLAIRKLAIATSHVE